MVKVALLIGVNQYEAGLSPLPKAAHDVEAMERVLKKLVTNGFSQVSSLIDPDPQPMREAIESIFAGREKDDLVLLFFSGHGIKDDQGKLHFATRKTRKTVSGELIRSTAVAANFVQEMMTNSRCQHQVLILDCCFSGAFAAGMAAKDSGVIDIAPQLGGEGRAVLTSSTSTQYSFEEQDTDLSIYTHYIVEGIETGGADLDGDGWIEVEELHDYARRKVQEAAPAMSPEIYAVKEGFKIRLTQAPVGDPKLRYRMAAERHARRGEISVVGREILTTLQTSLGVSQAAAAAIEAEILKPFQEYQRSLQRYEQTLKAALQREQPLSAYTRAELAELQRLLGLRDQDIEPIEAALTGSEASLKPPLKTADPQPSPPESQAPVLPRPAAQPARSSRQVIRKPIRQIASAGCLLVTLFCFWAAFNEAQYGYGPYAWGPPMVTACLSLVAGVFLWPWRFSPQLGQSAHPRAWQGLRRVIMFGLLAFSIFCFSIFWNEIFNYGFDYQEDWAPPFFLGVMTLTGGLFLWRWH